MPNSLIRNRWLSVARVLVSVAVTVTLCAVAWMTLLDRKANPICHKNLFLAIGNWQEKNSTRDFPNIDGDSAASIAALDELSVYRQLKSHYRYVPGLNRDDPEGLVLFYISQPTRWTSHVSTPWIFTPMEWILVPVDMEWKSSRNGAGPGELSERVSFEEFRARLRKTLDYVKAKERPHWETVVKQHTEFLDRTEKMLAGTK